jgi:hypothetical protein
MSFQNSRFTEPKIAETQNLGSVGDDRDFDIPLQPVVDHFGDATFVTVADIQATRIFEESQITSVRPPRQLVC